MNPVPLRIGACDQELLAKLGLQIVTAGPGAPAEKRRGVLVLAPSSVLIFYPLRGRTPSFHLCTTHPNVTP